MSSNVGLARIPSSPLSDPAPINHFCESLHASAIWNDLVYLSMDWVYCMLCNVRRSESIWWVRLFVLISSVCCLSRIRNYSSFSIQLFVIDGLHNVPFGRGLGRSMFTFHVWKTNLTSDKILVYELKVVHFTSFTSWNINQTDTLLGRARQLAD